MIDLEDEIGSLEGAKDNLVLARRKHLEARNYLEDFERKIRKHGYLEIVKQSNAQKMQLAFEHAVAQNPENWERWVGLKSKLESAEISLEEAKAEWEFCVEKTKLLGVVKDDNLD